MRAEVIRIVADWLADGTNGVNAMLIEVPVDVGDSQPSNVTLADETRNAWVARAEAPRSVSTAGPYLAVQMHQEPVTFDGIDAATGFTYQQGQIPVAVRYVTANSDSEAGNLAGSITLRAARWSLNLLSRHENRTSRERNKIRLDDFTITEYPVTEQLGDAVITGGLLIRCNATDALVEPAP